MPARKPLGSYANDFGDFEADYEASAAAGTTATLLLCLSVVLFVLAVVGHVWMRRKIYATAVEPQ